MTSSVQEILEKIQQLTLDEQRELFHSLSDLLQVTSQDGIPYSVKRTKPVVNLDEYKADFWPDDESIDELIAFIRQERATYR